MGVGGVGAFQRVPETGCKVVGRIEIASCEKTPGQDAKPPLHLIEPGPMGGRKVTHMLMGRIAQERPSLHAAGQGLGEGGDGTPLGHETAHLTAPVGIEIIDPPIVAQHSGQLMPDVGQMCCPIRTGAGLAEIPHEMPRRHHERGQQRAHAMAYVLVLALCRFARWHWLGGGGTLQNLPPRFFVGADDSAPRLVEAERLDRELTDIVGLACEVWSVTVEPVHAPVRLEVRRLQHAPEAGATHGPRPIVLLEGRNQILETPPGGGTMIRGWFPGGHRQHIPPLSGGKSAAGDPSAAHPAGP